MEFGNTRRFEKFFGSMPFLGTTLLQPSLRAVYEADSKPALRWAMRKATFNITGFQIVHSLMTQMAINDLAVDAVRFVEDPAVRPVAEAMFDAAFGFTNASLIVAEAILLVRLRNKESRDLAAATIRPRKIALQKTSFFKSAAVTYGALAIMHVTEDADKAPVSAPPVQRSVEPRSPHETAPPIRPQGGVPAALD